ncbi:DAK2 domain-containing protein [Corynebacterium caspium]|uniref:DAK2 domain-containing protein n=1 Tax=Corynebacterium caspium TaxID=234828 RepID=UPI00037DC5E7|nr:DAK2 domain-containing protein [Corynebacterium caspium]WKD59395.1 DAK2 domain protein [Corynebacterium caspium DSM 44850]
MATSLSVLNGSQLHSWARRAVAELSARRAEINQLNVFPVPDADTGSNMAHTMEAALEAVELLPQAHPNASEVAAALATGAVRGARGNSGVVLSQVLRGVAEAANADEIDSKAISHSLVMALKFVDRAIAEPVEGTVITVLRAAAEAAQTEESLAAVVNNAATAAREALAKTPSQLAVLREAGVVDAGGQGLVVLLAALESEVLGEELAAAPAPVITPETAVETASASCSAKTAPNTAAELQTSYLEIMFYFAGDLEKLKALLQPLGDSLVIAAENPAQGTIHIHSTQAGKVIETAYKTGQVSDLRLEALVAHSEEIAVGTDKGGKLGTRLLIAIAPLDSVEGLFQEAGAVIIVPGVNALSAIQGEIATKNPSEIVVLPNGYLSEAELLELSAVIAKSNLNFAAISSASLVSGIAALAVHDPVQDFTNTISNMQEAATAMRTAVIYPAAQAHLSDAGPCAKGDILAVLGTAVEVSPLGSSGLPRQHLQAGAVVFVGESVTEAVIMVCRQLLNPNAELLTLLVREDIDLDITEIKEALSSHVDITVYPIKNSEYYVEIGVE